MPMRIKRQELRMLLLFLLDAEGSASKKIVRVVQSDKLLLKKRTEAICGAADMLLADYLLA